MKKVIFICIAFVFFYQCKREDNSIKYPECCKASIDQILSLPPSSPRASIEKYLYNGQEVYLINSINCPDCPSGTFQTSECEKICSGTIGLSGENDCSTEFLENIVFVEVVWKDQR